MNRLGGTSRICSVLRHGFWMPVVVLGAEVSRSVGSVLARGLRLVWGWDGERFAAEKCRFFVLTSKVVGWFHPGNVGQ